MRSSANRKANATHQRWKLLKILLFAAAAIGALADYRQGFWLQRFLPLPALDTSVSAPWFLDSRLAALRQNGDLCPKVLKRPISSFIAVADQPYKDGCGWKHAVNLKSAAGSRLPTNTMTCEMAAAFSMWMEHSAQTEAERIFNSRVVSVDFLGSYACRNIVGNSLWQAFRSQHATANAIDVSGFTLANGTVISVKRDWHGEPAKSKFLNAVHDSACRYFRVVLSPDYNSAHHDHFHVDRGYLRTCK